MEIKTKVYLGLSLVLTLALLVSCQEVQAPEAPEEVQVDQVQEEDQEVVELEDTSFLDNYEKEPIQVDYVPSQIDPQVPAYTIEADLSNVENIDHFGNFSDDQRAFLIENGFLLTRTGLAEYLEGPEFEYDQFYHIYDENEYKGIGSFVTSDSLTHIFHVFYTGFLRDLEENQLYPKTIDLLDKLIKSNMEIYKTLDKDRLKTVQEKNIGLLAVASSLAGHDQEDLPDEIRAMVEEELENIQGLEIADSAITGNKVDFSQLKPRGHYTRSENLEKYFQTTMYLGQMGYFPVEDKQVNEEAILASLLLTHSAYKDPEIYKTWSELVDPMTFLVESADDLSFRDFGKILYGVYGKDPDLNDLDNLSKLTTVIDQIRKLPEPQIASFKGHSFRVLPQRAVLDNVLMQNVVDTNQPSERPVYSGLDLMAAFDNNKALEILGQDDYNSHWDEYEQRTEENIEAVQAMEVEDWQKNVYRGWLWMLESYNNTYGPGYPLFMQSEAWQKKDLVSALGSYAELKHDTVLYSKPVIAQAGGGYMDIPKSYIEPNLELYEKLSWLLEYTKVNLKDRGLLSDYNEVDLENFKILMDQIIVMVKKQLNNEPLTEEEYIYLNYIGGTMEQLSTSFVEGDDESEVYYDIEYITDRRMPVVVDLMAVVDNVVDLEVGKIQSIGTGKPVEIYAIYPQDGKLYMGRGAVFSYHEFLADERLTDEEWHEILLNEEVSYPDWYSDIIFDQKEDFEGNTDIAW